MRDDSPREHTVDLRSDTVTRPTQAMRRAMAQAEVGDDVLGEDPTVRALEARAAELLGKEAALFVPSGTMGNQLALLTHTQRGQEVICPRPSHVQEHEVGAAAVLAAVTLVPIDTPDGQMPLDAVEEAIRTPDIHHPTTGLILVECPHTDGEVPELEYLTELAGLARRHGLPIHMDGARIFNAALALGCSAAEIAATADSVMFCLSKGLGAPVGSMLCGPSDFVARARKYRKMLGGGMRQAGILAAAGLYALEHHLPLLARDHEKAARLAELLEDAPGMELIRLRHPTNMVWAALDPRLDPSEVVRLLAERQVAAYPPLRDRWRLVVHLDVSEEDVAYAASTIRQTLEELLQDGGHPWKGA